MRKRTLEAQMHSSLWFGLVLIALGPVVTAFTIGDLPVADRSRAWSICAGAAVLGLVAGTTGAVQSLRKYRAGDPHRVYAEQESSAQRIQPWTWVFVGGAIVFINLVEGTFALPIVSAFFTTFFVLPVLWSIGIRRILREHPPQMDTPPTAS